MNTATRKITEYYYEVQTRSNFPDFDFDSKTPFVEALLDDVLSGVLKKDTADKLFAAKDGDSKEQHKSPNNVQGGSAQAGQQGGSAQAGQQGESAQAGQQDESAQAGQQGERTAATCRLDPAAEPAAEPAADPAAEPAAEPAVEPAADPAAEPIDVVISLVTLIEDGTFHGLLMLPASLKPDGTLDADINNAEPWIPATRLKGKGSTDYDLMVGDLSSLWKFRKNEGVADASQAKSWQDAVDYSFKLFHSVADDEFEKETRHIDEEKDRRANADEDRRADAEESRHANADDYEGRAIEKRRCFIRSGSVIVANGAVIELYKYLLQPDCRDSPVYEHMISLDGPAQVDEEGIDGPAYLCDNAKSSCGSMSDGFPLTASQRRAVHAFLHDGDGDVTAVSGPPGTGKTTMLQSVVANMIVHHALDGRDAPLVVCMSTNNQAVTNIIDSFGSVVKKDHAELDYRWLPAYKENGASDEPLSSFATYCPSGAKRDGAAKKGYLVEDVKKGGVYTQYAEPGYCEAARPYFMDCAFRFSENTGQWLATENVQTIGDALCAILQDVDEARMDLIDAMVAIQENAPTGSEPAETELETRLSSIRDARDSCQQSMKRWYVLKPQEPVDATDESILINVNRQQEDDFPISCNRFSEVLGYYNDGYVQYSQQLEQLEEDQRVQRNRKKHADAAQGEYGEKVEQLVSLGALAADDVEKIKGCETLAELDEKLDTTVRYAEFWMAVHVYEAKWLEYANGDELIPQNERWKTSRDSMERYWTQVAALTPCFVMTAYQLPKYFKLGARKGVPAQYDVERIDLLVVDEAGQVDVSIGAPSFALPKRAMVVGDVRQLAPVWGIDPESDEALFEGLGSGLDWEDLKAKGLTASDHSSIMAAASSASNWCYKGGEPGLFLSEHFRCREEIIGYCNELIYKGMLEPKRPVKGYALEGNTESPFLFFEVDGSKDTPRGSSRCNEVEAMAVARWIEKNFSFFYDVYHVQPEDADKKVAEEEIIGVVTPFKAQASLIACKLEEVGGRGLKEKITVGTAHKLQGAERPVIVFSSVYGNNSGKASFVDGTLELMNVAVSRAKDLLIVFGGKTRWEDRGPVFKLVKELAALSNCSFVADAPSDNADAPDEAACVQAPSAVPAVVDRHEPGYATASEMVRSWKEADADAGTAGLNVQKLNKLLLEAGYIEEADSDKVPTEREGAIGIAICEKRDDDGALEYRMPLYSPCAQKTLLVLLENGELTGE